MRRYTILKINRNIGAVTHTYTAAERAGEFTGDYVCPTLENDTKIVTDFICMPNSSILSVRAETGTRLGQGPTFIIGERTTQGVITGFKPDKAHVDVFLDGTRTQSVNINTITKRVVAAASVREAVVPSRGQQTPDPFLTLQANIEANADIRLEKTLKKTIPATVQLFLQKFFEEWNNEKNTIFVNDKTIQTTMGRRRSLGDIYKLCKYYFPTCTLREVLTLLYVTLPTYYTRGFRTSYCGTINKRVWYYGPGSDNDVYDDRMTDEYNNIYSFYKTKL